MSFIASMMMLHSPMKRLTHIAVSLQQGIAAAESIFTFLDTPPERDGGSRQLGRCAGAVSYQQVSFSYSSDKGPVLHDINLQIAPGQSVAFVGRSGSGKSTLVSLLARFYDVTTGQILIDGHDIRELPLERLRAQIALVSQHITLFNDTIANNIAYGSLGSASREEIIKAAEAAHAMEFIRELPAGLDTMVGENGVLLSGGQRQRLAIARALLKDAPILILDEATSALDTESERHIQAALEGLMANRTTLVIAHRLSTIEKADNIVVMEKGRIIESGTHAALLARNGQYAVLYNMQFQDKPE
jgi:subfamily B ATP-binding cassette protein MsbA